MCGIVGLLAKEGDSLRLMNKVEDATLCLTHRGPDGQGTQSFNVTSQFRCFLGHTRLAIIDLSSAGLQPFQSEDKSKILTFNGEIYNYKELRSELENLGISFNTATDTEVLLQALVQWGTKALDKLEGMFSFGFLDLEKNELLLARDPFGIKPLYYAVQDGSLAFASEPRALRKIFPALNAINGKTASDYLLFGYTDRSSQTFFDGISSILPGHYMKVSIAEKLSVREPYQYWDPTPGEVSSISFSESKDTFLELLSDSMSLHMRSDVAVGAALSGGLDSSSVVSLMRHLYPEAELHTFSYIASDSNWSEETWVDMLVNHTKSISHKVRIHNSTEFEGDLDDLIRSQGEPMAGLSVYAQYKVFEMTKRIGIRVTLDGQGADELLAGYQGYPEARALTFLDRGDLVGLVSFLRSWGRWPGRSLHFFLGVVFAEHFPTVRRSSQFIEFAQKLGFMGNHDLDFFTSEALSLARRPPMLHPRKKALHGRRLSEALSMELGPKRLTALLRVADRNSMRFSTESRLPFLNRKLAEFVLRLPEQYLLSDSGETKHIMRQSLRGIVPQQILDRRDKIGFEATTDGWGKGSKSLLEISENLEGLPLVNVAKARGALLRVQAGVENLDANTWRVMNYARWAQLEGLV